MGCSLAVDSTGLLADQELTVTGGTPSIHLELPATPSKRLLVALGNRVQVELLLAQLIARLAVPTYCI